MTISPAQIGNLALGHLGVARVIASLTDRNTEARTCNRFYERARDTAQSRYAWKNGLKFVALALLPDNPWSDEWLYPYRMPADCKWFRRISLGVGDAANQPPHKIVSDDTGEVILTNVLNAKAEYSVLVEDPALWTDEQVNATSYKLAALMARTFDEDNASSTRKEMEQQYEIELSRAHAKDLNQQQPPENPKSEFETCRF